MKLFKPRHPELVLGSKELRKSQARCRNKFGMTRSSSRGFTLLEILVAVFILGIIAVIMVRGLQIVIRTKDNLERIDSRLNTLEITMTYLQSDLGNSINRPITLSNGQTNPPVYLEDDTWHTLNITRANVANPLAAARSTLQRVAYQFKKGTLVRLSWPVLDPVASTTPQSRVLLKHVKDVQWQFLGGDNRFYSSWPSTNAANQPLPKAIEVIINIDKWGTIKRLFLVHNSVPSKSSKIPLKS